MSNNQPPRRNIFQRLFQRKPGGTKVGNLLRQIVTGVGLPFNQKPLGEKQPTGTAPTTITAKQIWEAEKKRLAEQARLEAQRAAASVVDAARNFVANVADGVIRQPTRTRRTEQQPTPTNTNMARPQTAGFASTLNISPMFVLLIGLVFLVANWNTLFAGKRNVRKTAKRSRLSANKTKTRTASAKGGFSRIIRGKTYTDPQKWASAMKSLRKK